jgi:hypothetical protein
MSAGLAPPVGLTLGVSVTCDGIQTVLRSGDGVLCCDSAESYVTDRDLASVLKQDAERSYLLHKTRRLFDDLHTLGTSTAGEARVDDTPAYLQRRAVAGEEMPVVVLGLAAGEGEEEEGEKGVAPGKGKRKRDDCEDVTGGVVEYAIKVRPSSSSSSSSSSSWPDPDLLVAYLSCCDDVVLRWLVGLVAGFTFSLSGGGPWLTSLCLVLFLVRAGAQERALR